MTITSTLGMAALGLLLVSACGRSSAERAPEPEPRPATPPTAPAAALDPRTPLPLTAMMATHQKQQMRDHLRVVQEVVGALATEDYDAIVASAARIAWSEQQAMMCEHMGAGAAGFAELGETFHRTADGIVAAARSRDRAGVAAALEATLVHCTGCHETYRQEIVVDDAGAPAMMHGQ